MKLEKLVADMPLKHRPRIAILTGSTKTKERRAVYASLADGSTDIVVGTHSLITDALEFKKLGLAVIDEQHRRVRHEWQQMVYTLKCTCVVKVSLAREDLFNTHLAQVLESIVTVALFHSHTLSWTHEIVFLQLALCRVQNRV